MDTAKWPQEFVVKPMNEIVTNTCLKQPDPSASGGPVERKARPEKDQALNCPRCNSLNTKFCYYNNYSLTQPRYFCKDCRRYWTEGGSLRNIPIGGGIRKNKRSSPSSSASSKKALLVSTPPHLNPKTASVPKVQELGFGSAHCEVKDLNLAFSQGFGTGQSIPEFLQVPPSTMKNNTSLVSTSSALELLGISNLRPPFMPTPFPSTVHDPSSGFGLSYPQFQDFMRPAPLGFSLPLHQQEGEGEGEGEVEVSTTNNGRPLLQFESLNLPVSSSSTNTNSGVNATANDHEHEEGEADQSAGFWNGMLSAGGAAASGSWQ